MNIILFSHPVFTSSQSMPRFTKMLEQAYVARGHQVQVWLPLPKLYTLLSNTCLLKWAGYIDQYIFFPLWVRNQLKTQPDNTLYVFTDQALGPWVWLVKKKPHIVHVHDLLALRSALGDIPQIHVSRTGAIYQRYIRQGFRQARHFISVSNKTRDDLHSYGKVSPVISEVVYNGQNFPFVPMLPEQARQCIANAGLPVPAEGMLLHISGNQWYKNVLGVIRMYAHYAQTSTNPLPLWLVGPHLNMELQAALDEVPPQGKVLFFYKLDNQVIQAAYSLSRAFIFPSHAEGFGWPIIEAQACGCPVITTADSPMNEVGGPVARYLPRLLPQDNAQVWANNATAVLIELLNLDEAARADVVAQGIAWVERFNTDAAIEGYLRVYRQVVEYEHTNN